MSSRCYAKPWFSETFPTKDWPLLERGIELDLGTSAGTLMLLKHTMVRRVWSLQGARHKGRVAQGLGFACGLPAQRGLYRPFDTCLHTGAPAEAQLHTSSPPSPQRHTCPRHGAEHATRAAGSCKRLPLKPRSQGHHHHSLPWHTHSHPDTGPVSFTGLQNTCCSQSSWQLPGPGRCSGARCRWHKPAGAVLPGRPAQRPRRCPAG